MHQNIHFLVQKTLNKQQQQKQEHKKAKETNEEKRISPEIRLRIFSLPAFPETRVLFFLACA